MICGYRFHSLCVYPNGTSEGEHVKREVNRERKLPAFSLSVGELEVLWSRLAALFNDSVELYASIDIRLPSEQLEFSNIEELRQYERLPARVTNFTVTLAQKGCRITIRSGMLFAKAQVDATSETEAWCAGAIDTVYSFVQSHKLWYNWFVSAPIGWVLVIVANIPSAVMTFMPKGVERVFMFGWLGALLTMSLLYFGRGRLLPSAMIRISESKGFVRNNVAELSLAIAVFSAILTVIGWFVAK